MCVEKTNLVDNPKPSKQTNTGASAAQKVALEACHHDLGITTGLDLRTTTRRVEDSLRNYELNAGGIYIVPKAAFTNIITRVFGTSFTDATPRDGTLQSLMQAFNVKIDPKEEVIVVDLDDVHDSEVSREEGEVLSTVTATQIEFKAADIQRMRSLIQDYLKQDTLDLGKLTKLNKQVFKRTLTEAELQALLKVLELRNLAAKIFSKDHNVFIPKPAQLFIGQPTRNVRKRPLRENLSRDQQIKVIRRTNEMLGRLDKFSAKELAKDLHEKDGIGEAMPSSDTVAKLLGDLGYAFGARRHPISILEEPD